MDNNHNVFQLNMKSSNYICHIYKDINLTSGQDGGIYKHALPPCTTTEKITSRPQKKYHLELSENPTVWKPDNQGFKEAKFIQTGSRGRDTETGGDVQRCSVVQRQNRRSHIHMWWIKISSDALGARDPSPTQARPLGPGFQCQEDKSL